MPPRPRRLAKYRWFVVVLVMSAMGGVIYRAVTFPPHFGDEDSRPRRYSVPSSGQANGARPFKPPKSAVQQSDAQLRKLWEEVNTAGPAKSLLVFGLGEDSAYLANEVNRNGLTVFLEDNAAWTRKILSKYPHLNAHVVKYRTSIVYEDEKWKDKKLWKQLEMELPSSVRDREWDVVLVDAPMGRPPRPDDADPHVPGTYIGPGRFQSIYMASLLTKPGGLIIVDDCERKVEDEYSKLMLGDIAVPEYRVPRGLMVHGSTGAANLQCGFRRVSKDQLPSKSVSPLSLSIPSESISHALLPAPKPSWPKPSGGSVVLRETEEDQAQTGAAVSTGNLNAPYLANEGNRNGLTAETGAAASTGKLNAPPTWGRGARPFQPPRGAVQQSDAQLRKLWEEVNTAGPAKSLLVFGLGEDSAYLANEVNRNGLTVFLEDNAAWTRKILSKYPHLTAHVVKYRTSIVYEDEKWKDKQLWKQLEMELPSSVRDREWDVVLVDAPMGRPPRPDDADPHVPGTYIGPGRFQSIYMASLLTKPGGLIIVDDCERKVEDEYSKLMLGDIAVPEYRVPRGLMVHGSTGAANLQCGFRRLGKAPSAMSQSHRQQSA